MCLGKAKKMSRFASLRVDFGELDKPERRSQLYHLYALCPWANNLSSEPPCLHIQNRDDTLLQDVAILTFEAVMYIKGIVKCLHIVTFN